MFGMTINIAMVVHDKINLQNSVDFASIYVAQKLGRDVKCHCSSKLSDSTGLQINGVSILCDWNSRYCK